MCGWGAPVRAGRLGKGGPNLRFEAELALWHNSVNAPPGPLSPLLPPFPGKRAQGGKGNGGTPGQKDRVHVSILQTARRLLLLHLSPLSRPSTVVSERRVPMLLPYQRAEGWRGLREIEKDLHPQGADDELGWVLYHWDGIGETSCRSGVHMCRDGSHVLMCVCVCDCEYVCVCNRFDSDTPPGALGRPLPNTFFSRMTSLAGRPAASDEQVRRVPRCDAR